jgi:hypothetical protein
MNKYIVTFGLANPWLSHRYIVVEAETDDAARRILGDARFLDLAANIFDEVTGMQVVARNKYQILER